MINPLSRDELLALPPVVSVETAARALGCGRTLAYDLLRRGEFPCRVLRLGSRWVVPTADLLRAIGVTSPPPGGDRPAA
jgi:predicted DNA-binding transcriptional regulator AlpA